MVKQMAWDKIRNMKERGVQLAQDVAKGAREAAEDAGAFAKDVHRGAQEVGQALREAGEVVRKHYDTASRMAVSAYQAALDAKKSVENHVDRAQYEIDHLPETLHDLRSQVARAIDGNTDTVGTAIEKGANFANRASNYLSLRGIIVTLASDVVEKNAKRLVGDAAGALTKAIRGEKIAFLDVNVVEPDAKTRLIEGKNATIVMALVYLPEFEGSSKAGIAVLPERALLELEMENREKPEAAVFHEARKAVIEKKLELGLRVQTSLADEIGVDTSKPGI